MSCCNKTSLTNIITTNLNYVEHKNNNILSYIIECLFKELCTEENKTYAIGSIVLFFGKKIFNNNFNNNFKYLSVDILNANNNSEEYSRDFDILIPLNRYNKVIKKLSHEYKVTKLNTSNTYKSSLLKPRNIIKIEKIKLTFNSNEGNSMLSNFLYLKYNNLNLSINIDFVVYMNYTCTCGKHGYSVKVNKITENWPISNLSRNFYCYYSIKDDNIIFGELSKDLNKKDLTTQYSILNLIETIKKYLYRGDNDTTKSGDILKYSKNIPNNIGIGSIYQKINYVLDGFNTGLIKTYKLNYINVNNLKYLHKYFFIKNNFNKKNINKIINIITNDDCCICLNPLNKYNNKLYISSCNKYESPHIFHMSCILNHILPYLIYITNLKLNSSLNRYNNTYQRTDGDKCPQCRDELINVNSSYIEVNNILKSNDMIFDKNQFKKNIKIINII